MIDVREIEYSTTIPDYPSQVDCVSWSDDGILAVCSTSSIQIFLPTYDKKNIYEYKSIKFESTLVSSNAKKEVDLESSSSSSSSYLDNKFKKTDYLISKWRNNLMKTNFCQLYYNPIYPISISWSKPSAFFLGELSSLAGFIFIITYFVEYKLSCSI